MTVGAEVLGDHQVLPNLWLLPLRDVVAMGVWVAGFAGEHDRVARRAISGEGQAEDWRALQMARVSESRPGRRDFHAAMLSAISVCLVKCLHAAECRWRIDSMRTSPRFAGRILGCCLRLLLPPRIFTGCRAGQAGCWRPNDPRGDLWKAAQRHGKGICSAAEAMPDDKFNFAPATRANSKACGRLANR